MLRNCLTKRLVCWTALPCHTNGALKPVSGTPWWNATVSQNQSGTTKNQSLPQSGPTKDYSVPNAGWNQGMLEEFNKFTELETGGTWQRLPSYRNSMEVVPEFLEQVPWLRKERGTRYFLRNIDAEGLGFEYTMFLNPSEKRLVSIVQFGPYLEGPPGFAHGGSIATILDSVLGALAVSVVGNLMTANLNITYKSPIPLESVVLVESRLSQKEGRKVFVTGEIRSRDGQTLHADAKAVLSRTSEWAAYKLNIMIDYDGDDLSWIKATSSDIRMRLYGINLYTSGLFIQQRSLPSDGKPK